MAKLEMAVFNIDEFRVSAGEVKSLLISSIDEGMDLNLLLDGLHLPHDYLDNHTNTISIENCWRIFNAQYHLVAEESHQLSKRPLSRGSTQLVFNNLQHSSTLHEALVSLANTYNVIHGGSFNFVKKHGNTLSYIVDDRDFHYVGEAQYFAIEFALLRFHCALCILSGVPLKLLRVTTVRETLPDFLHHLNLFNCKIVTGQETYELVYDAVQADIPFAHTEKIDIHGNLLNIYLKLIGKGTEAPLDADIVKRTKEIIHECFLQHLPCDQPSVAGLLHMSVATLRRRLQDAGVHFREVLDQVNAELAVNTLHELKSSEKAAQRLGYCDIRSFKRAFIRWHGVSPAEYMKSHKILSDKNPRRS